MKKKWYGILFRRRFIVAVLIIIQAMILLWGIQIGIERYAFLEPTLQILSAFAALYIISRQDTAGYKLIWTVLILLLPVFGGLFYILYRIQSSTERLARPKGNLRPAMKMPGDSFDAAVRMMPGHKAEITALQKFSGFPVYENTKTTFFASGETKFEALLEDLRNAQRYIFLEYFIVGTGKMWDSILEILEEKAQKGLDVRLMYDDMGSFMILPPKYKGILEKKGIKCMVFNPFRPFLSAVQNNRNHRKIAIIDGKVAYTGGVNLADEYINHIERFGHWRDAAIRIEGAAAWSMTVMFLEMWGLCTKKTENAALYYPYGAEGCNISSDGFVQPYCDSPLDRDHVGERTYMQMIMNAKEYLYISTPYLIIDDSMLSALVTAAQSGVDVRILTPHKWDKPLVHMTTRSYYRSLLRGGVKIYEYTPGFNHAKTFVSDDETATVGTVNLDFRSLYLHFECGVKLYGTESVKAVRQDFLHTLSRCMEITEKDLKGGTIVRTAQSILRLFAPLM